MIPVIVARGKTLPEAFENSLIELYNNGERMKTQYDNKDDPPSIDATANITIEEPESDPMIYKLFPGGIGDLREYVMELQGVKDHWVKNMNDPEDTRWEYTYHQRLTDWGTWYENGSLSEGPIEGRYKAGLNLKEKTDQIEKMVENLVIAPHTRRAQAITWMPFMDNNVSDPPCLQSIWCRMTTDVTPSMLWLNTNIRFRSNDAWGAAFMNMFGLTHFIRVAIANPIEENLRVPVKLGRINWQADSYHIYGKNIEEFKNRFINKYNPYTLSERVYCMEDPEIKAIWNEALEDVKNKIKKYDEEHNHE